MIRFRTEIRVSDQELPIKAPAYALTNQHPMFRYGPSCIQQLAGRETLQGLYKDHQRGMSYVEANLASLTLADQWDVANPKLVDQLLATTQAVVNNCTISEPRFKALVRPLIQQNKNDIEQAIAVGTVVPHERFGVQDPDRRSVISHPFLDLDQLIKNEGAQ